TGIDDLTTVSFGATRDRRNNPVNPTDGSVLTLSTAQSIPVGQGNILSNRLQANYTQYVPTRIINSSEKEPEVFAFNLQGGTTIGDLPPYNAFNLGGPNSVRGYGQGEVGTGRSYVLASAEYRIPILSSPVSGVLFADFASDLGSGKTVPGDPAGVREKPGTGFGYGVGVRVKSPLGIIRADYGINDQGDDRLQFGLGQRF
ncbi:MAG TPA: BamA/TamA family outer membrane protein, partial [Candidatus Obscuribacterales bacterium]